MLQHSFGSALYIIVLVCRFWIIKNIKLKHFWIKGSYQGEWEKDVLP